jgi:hypothetical protein
MPDGQGKVGSLHLTYIVFPSDVLKSFKREAEEEEEEEEEEEG